MNRRHDIDALRALAFALLILYHVGMYYVAGWDWHLKSPHAADWLQLPMRAVNLWRMDLVFLISGLSMGFLLRGSGTWALLGRRSWRLLLPLAFGMVVLVPFQPYAEMLANGQVEPGFGTFLRRYYAGGPWPAGAFAGSDFGVTWNHLWYLPYLWLYTTVFLLLRSLLASGAVHRLQAAFTGLRGARLLVLPLLPLMVASLLLWPFFPPTHDLIADAWLHSVYFTLFLYGCWIGVDVDLWAELRRLRWTALGLALAQLLLYFVLRSFVVPEDPLLLRWPARLAADAYKWLAIVAILGWAHHSLNRPWSWLTWANESVYPWYLLHQSLIIVFVIWLAPLQLGPYLEPLLLVAGTVLGCAAITGVVRRVDGLRPLFGLGRTRRQQGGQQDQCAAQQGTG